MAINDEAIRKKEFGHLLGKHRIARSLNKSELAKRSYIDPHKVREIEDGKAKLDIELITLLANGLRLGGYDRTVFFEAGGFIPNTTDDRPNWYRVEGECYRYIQHPAFVLDSLLNVESCNSSALIVWGLRYQELKKKKNLFQGAGPNVIRLVFDPAFNSRRLFGDAWGNYVLRNVLLFHQITASQRGRDEYIKLKAELDLLPGFLDMWNKVEEPDTSGSQNKTEYLLPPHVITAHTRFGDVRYLSCQVALGHEFADKLFATYHPVDPISEKKFIHMNDFGRWWYSLDCRRQEIDKWPSDSLLTKIPMRSFGKS